MTRLVIALAACAVAFAADDPGYESAKDKLDRIEGGRVEPGSLIRFTPAEINAWARVRVPQIVPEGIREPRVELGEDAATGSALIDFLKMRQGQGAAPNWFIARLIEGERPVKVSVRVESRGGRCTVFLTRAEISGVAANATVLDFLIRTFFLPLYPDARINEPFDLDYKIERIEVRPSAVSVTIRK